MDEVGNLFIADTSNNRIRRVDFETGIITSVAGTAMRELARVRELPVASEEGFSGDGGPATSAQLDVPAGVAVDGEGNLFIADKGSHRIRAVRVP